MISIQIPFADISLFAFTVVGFWLLGFFSLTPHLKINGQEPDCAVRLFVSTVSALVIVGWLATTLALIGMYALRWVALLLLAIDGALFAFILLRRLPVRLPCARGGWCELGLVIWMLIGFGLYLRPHEYVLGGSDAGSYINIAAETARTGAYLQRDTWNQFLAEHKQVTLRTQPQPMLTRHLQFVGWYIDDVDPAISRPQFFPFYPVLLSVAMSVGGVRAGFYVSPFVAVLGIAALYLLSRQLFGKAVALPAALFLTITSTQIFFARYPTTEPLTMLLLFAGFLALQVLWDEGTTSPLWGVFGGIALGAALLTRIDLPLVLAIVGGGLLWIAWQGRWHVGWSAFAVTLLLFTAQMIWVVWLFTWPYFWNTYLSVYGLFVRSSWLVVGAAMGVLVFGGLALTLGPQRFGFQLQRLERSTAVRWTLAILIVSLSAYAYFLRPILEPPRIAIAWPGNVEFPILNGQNWLRMGWYLTPLGIALATAGLAMIVVRERLARLTIVVGIGVLTTFQYVYNIMNTPYHIYTMRRYMPIVIPMLWIFAAYAIVTLPRFSKLWMMPVARGMLIVALVGGLLYQDRYVVRARDYAGALAQLHEFHQQIRPDAIVLFAEPKESFFADAFGVPLRSIFAHPVATVRTGSQPSKEDDPDASLHHQQEVIAFLEALFTRAEAENRPIQLLAVEPIPLTVRNSLTLVPSGSYAFTTQMLMNTFDDFPSVIQTVHYGIEIYDVMSPDNTEKGLDSIEVDIGSVDGTYLDEGFWSKEYLPGAPTMRWTKDVAKLTTPLPHVDGDIGNEQLLEIQVRAMIYRPEMIEPAPVIVQIGEHEVGSFTPTEKWTTYVFRVPYSALPSADSIQIQFLTETFTPADSGLNGDTRALGFLLDWVKVLPAQASG